MCNASKDLVIFVSLHLLLYNNFLFMNYFVDLTRERVYIMTRVLKSAFI